VTKQIRKNLVHPNVRTGAARQHIQKAATVRLGTAQGDHATGKGKTNNPHIDLVGPKRPISVQQGSEWSRTVEQGPGGGCNPMRSGSQGTHGGVAGSKPNTQDPLSGWKR
jgi:hypothetical protein